MAEHRAAIDIEAAPERVFEFLVTDTGMTAWMGQWASLDPVPGGHFAVDIAGFPARGTFSRSTLLDGWNHFLPRLARAATGEQLPPDTWTPRPDRHQPEEL